MPSGHVFIFYFSACRHLRFRFFVDFSLASSPRRRGETPRYLQFFKDSMRLPLQSSPRSSLLKFESKTIHYFIRVLDERRRVPALLLRSALAATAAERELQRLVAEEAYLPTLPRNVQKRNTIENKDKHVRTKKKKTLCQYRNHMKDLAVFNHSQQLGGCQSDRPRQALSFIHEDI